jgi:hypothetical protein
MHDIGDDDLSPLELCPLPDALPTVTSLAPVAQHDDAIIAHRWSLLRFDEWMIRTTRATIDRNL